MFELDGETRIKKLSKGTKQKVAIAAAFMGSPELLILDEPTSGLDPLMQGRFVDLILEEKRRGATILLSSHMFEEVERTCDRTVILRQGRVAAVERLEDLKRTKRKGYTVTFRDSKSASAFASDWAGETTQEGVMVHTEVTGSPDGFLKAVSAYPMADLDLHRESLEELFLHYYGGKTMNKHLFAKEAKATLPMLVIFMAVLTMYATVITTLFDPEMGDSLRVLSESMPQMFAAFGMLDVGATLAEFLVNCLYGFLLVVLPMVMIILLANRLVARHVDHGSMAYLLATPNTRKRLVRTQAYGLWIPILILVVYTMVLLLVLAEVMFPGELDIPGFLKVNFGLCCLLVFLCGLCFAVSCCCNDSRLSGGSGAGVCIAFVLVQMLSQASEKLEALRYATPLTLFDPKAILAGERWALWGALVLLLAGKVFFAIGETVFTRRDLPI